MEGLLFVINFTIRSGFRVAGIWFLVSGFWFLVSGFWFLVSGFWFLVAGWFALRSLISDLWFRLSGRGHWWELFFFSQRARRYNSRGGRGVKLLLASGLIVRLERHRFVRLVRLVRISRHRSGRGVMFFVALVA